MKSAVSLPFEPISIIVVCLIVFLSLFTLFTTSADNSVFILSADNVVLKQALFFIIGIILMILIMRIHASYTQSLVLQMWLIGISIVLLAGLFVAGGLVNQTHRWYIFGPFLFEPSEFVKYPLIMWTALLLTQSRFSLSRRVLYTLAGILIPITLIFLQPDAGTSIMATIICFSVFSVWLAKYPLGRKFLALAFGLVVSILLGIFIHPVFFAGIIILLAGLSYQDFKFLQLGIITLALGALIIGLGTFLWQTGLFKDYQKQRILSFVGVEEETFQIRQAKIAIGSGGLFGKGPGQGTQSRLRFLPEYRTDFIFAAFIEERGLIGALALITLYLILIMRMLILALHTKDEYMKLFTVGLFVKIWVEVFINIGMNAGLLPTKGVALPFMSYGGSSMLSNFVLIGLFQALYRTNRKNDKISFGHDRLAAH